VTICLNCASSYVPKMGTLDAKRLNCASSNFLSYLGLLLFLLLDTICRLHGALETALLQQAIDTDTILHCTVATSTPVAKTDRALYLRDCITLSRTSPLWVSAVHSWLLIGCWIGAREAADAFVSESV